METEQAVEEAIRSFPFDAFGMDDVADALESDPDAQEWVDALVKAICLNLEEM